MQRPRDDQRSPPALELRGVHKRYREGDVERDVLRGIDLTLQPGETVALLGPSGSGKSTILHVAGGVDRPSSGSVRLAGQDLARLSEAARARLRRRQVGFVFQAFHLVPTLSAAENVALPLELDGRLDAAGRARVAELLARVGLGDRASARPDHLSGGEQQRVAIARALVHSPTLLLADEPTGNLDEDTAEVVIDLLTGLACEAGVATLVATHSAHFARRCDRALRLDHGLVRDATGAAPSGAPA
ncbi:MAG: ABC transporter ATP-binding protein [Planctomycetes bacterium]|nr:ABC transporter ATP-binding protein [Planctomycetota bacterium]